MPGSPILQPFRTYFRGGHSSSKYMYTVIVYMRDISVGKLYPIYTYFAEDGLDDDGDDCSAALEGPGSGWSGFSTSLSIAPLSLDVSSSSGSCLALALYSLCTLLVYLHVRYM
jgi:hypothetical protein